MVLEVIDTSEVGEEAIFEAASGITKIVPTPMSAAMSNNGCVAAEQENVEPKTKDPPIPKSIHATSKEVVEGRDDSPAAAEPLKMEEAVEPEKVEEEATEEQGVEVEEVKEVVYEAPSQTLEAQPTLDGLEERDFDKNPTALFALLQKKEWEAAMERATQNTEETKIWVSRREKDGRLRWRLLPVHAAIVFRAPEDVINTLLAAYPKGAQAKDDQGMLPLHLSFRNGSSEEIVNLLLTAFPESIDVKDRKGRIPLVLAQASSSQYKDAYLEALGRGILYYYKQAAIRDKAAVLAEQEAVFEAKLSQIRQTHHHELDAAKLESEQQQQDHRAKMAELEQELAKSEEASQVLVDHVNSLEAQLNSRTDTERFLATKIASLDSNLKNTSKEREELEQNLKLEICSLSAERDTYKAKLEETTQTLDQVQEALREKIIHIERREEEWAQTNAELEAQVKSHKIDWANAQANCAILDAQLRKKLETEHALASQVSSLAGKLAESNTEARGITEKYAKKIKDLEDERVNLRNSVQDLTKRLKLVATVLEDMSVEQQTIINNSKAHESLIGDALLSHAKIVAEAQEQEKLLSKAREEREAMRKQLEEQEEIMKANEEKRESTMQAIVLQSEHMERTKTAREDLLSSIATMGTEVQSVLDNIKSVIPEGLANLKNEDDIVDAVVKNVTSPVTVVEDETAEEGNSDEKKDEEEEICEENL